MSQPNDADLDVALLIILKRVNTPLRNAELAAVYVAAVRQQVEAADGPTSRAVRRTIAALAALDTLAKSLQQRKSAIRSELAETQRIAP